MTSKKELSVVVSLKMELFVIEAVITKCSILDVAAVLDPPLTVTQNQWT